MEGSIVTSVEHNHSGVAPALHNIIEKNVRTGIFQRIRNSIYCQSRIGNDTPRKTIHRIYRFLEKALSFTSTAVILIHFRHRALEKINILIKICSYFAFIYVLRIISSMLAENEKIHILSCHLAQQVPFHLTVFPKIEKTRLRSFVESIREILSEHHRLLSPNCKTVRVISVPRKICQVVKAVNLIVGIHDLTEIFPHYLIFVSRHHFRNLHSGRINVRTEILRALLREPVIEHSRISRISA